MYWSSTARGLRTCTSAKTSFRKIEYGLLASFISLVAVVIITNLGTSVNGMYGVIEGQVQAIPGGGS